MPTIPGNPYAWGALVVAVLVTLYLKGYLKLPRSGGDLDNSGFHKAVRQAQISEDSRSLGARYLDAKRAEAEILNRSALLDEFDKLASEKFAGPFVAPAPVAPAPASPTP